MNGAKNLAIAPSISESSSEAMKWYALQVRARYERSAQSVIRKRGVEVSLPLIKVKRQWSDRIKHVEQPLFSGFLFVRMDIGKGRLPVLQAPGVVRFVGTPKGPVPVAQEQMFWLGQMAEFNGGLQNELVLPTGVEVKVLFGPLVGLRGRVKQYRGKTRVVVWFDGIMQGASVEVDPALLVAV